MSMNDDFKKKGFPCSSFFEKGEARSGFTLIEVVVAMAIFTLIVGGVVMFSVNAVKANMKSQAMQEAIENARYAIDDLAKKIRTSSNVEVADGGKSLFFIDNLTVTKYCYQFVDDGSNKKMTVKSYALQIGGAGNTVLNATEYNQIIDCSTFLSTSTSVDVLGNDKVSIDGKFDVLKTDVSSDDPHRGFVRINVDIYYKKGLSSGDPADSAEAHIQTGVSILDYTRESGLEF